MSAASKKRVWKIVLLYAASLLILYFFVRSIDWSEFADLLKKAEFGYLLAALAVSLLSYVVRAYRWKFLFRPIKDPSFKNLYTTTCIGFMITSLLPGRLGEVVRPYLLGRKEGISKMSSFATVVVERFFDSLSVLALFVFYLFFLPLPTMGQDDGDLTITMIKKGSLILFLFLLAGIGFLVALVLKTGPVISFMDRLILRFLPERFREKLGEFLRLFAQGLGVLRQGRTLLIISFWSIVLWLGSGFSLWMVILAFQGGVGYHVVFLVLTLVAVAVLTPLPAGAGAFHVALQQGLVLFWGVDSDRASAVAIFYHAICFVPISIMGLIFFWLEGLSFREIDKIESQDRPPQA